MTVSVFDNSRFFGAYGWINLLLLTFLLVLLVLIFNDVFLLPRIGFVVLLAIHVILLFFIKMHFLRIDFDEENQKIEFHYNKKFGLNWLQKSRTSILPLKQLDGYTISNNSLGLAVLSFYKLHNKERFELGPFHVGYVSKQDRKTLEEFFGDEVKP